MVVEIAYFKQMTSFALSIHEMTHLIHNDSFIRQNVNSKK